MLMAYVYSAKNENDTREFAAHLAKSMFPGAIIALDGDLGAGKTTFTQALAAHLGVKSVVNSPTFTIIKEYKGEKYPFYHMDVYRVSVEEADELGLDEYFFGEGITVIEWASLIEELLPDQYLHIYIEVDETGSRQFRLEAIGEPYRTWCETLRENGVIV